MEYQNVWDMISDIKPLLLQYHSSLCGTDIFSKWQPKHGFTATIYMEKMPLYHYHAHDNLILS